jgi:threonine dehydrogenase-like Zn-dependent dehydrogenase
VRAVTVVPGTPGSLAIRTDVPDPSPLPGEAVVRMLEGGVCGTDTEIARGVLGEAPEGSPYLVLGHENLGVIEETPGDGFVSGDLVVSTVRRPCSGPCRPCTAGAYDFCLTGRFRERGIRGLHGFHSERYAESTRNLVKVPSSLRRVGVLLEPMTVVEKGIDQAYKAQERLPWAPQLAVVLGAGPVGILAAALLRLRGLEVAVAALEPEGSPKSAYLREAGLSYFSTSVHPIDTLPKRLGPVDLVFEATGVPSAIVPALGLLGPNGVLVLAGIMGGEGAQSLDVAGWNRSMVLGNRLVVGTVNASRQHFEAGIRDLVTAEERLPGWVERLITRRVPIDDARSALAKTPDDIKVVLDIG